MLMRRARAYGSSCSQLILVYLHPFCRPLLFCIQKSHKITKILYFPGRRSCKVIDVDTINTIHKHVTIACYDNIPKFRQKTTSFNAILPQVTAKWRRESNQTRSKRTKLEPCFSLKRTEPNPNSSPWVRSRIWSLQLFDKQCKFAT